MDDQKHQPLDTNLILPVGTQIVTLVDVSSDAGKTVRQIGSVGKIVKSPTDNNHAYVVLFPDGGEVSLRRHEIAIRKHVQNVSFGTAEISLADRNLYNYVIYKCIVGSRAFGLDMENSDIDRRGIYLPPAELHWSLYGVPEQIEETATQECYWELQKFLVLALKANPNVLECLYTPLIDEADDIAKELLEQRDRFLSKLVYQTYNGYVMSQFRKLEQDLRTVGKLKWKHVMHLIRLLISGITILKEQTVPVKVLESKDLLMSIRNGDLEWDTINETRLQLHKQFDDAYENSKLPERPDYGWANNFLIHARLTRVSKQ